MASPDTQLAPDMLAPTPASWAVRVLAQPLQLLNDHAHLEKKAASNALELMLRWPNQTPPELWVQTLTAIARDEIEHLGVVTRLLTRRGGELTKTHANPYASALRQLVRLGQGPHELTDRLLVSAMIEARSCERFTCLANACDDRELAKLYHGLHTSEAGHYRQFLKLAELVLPAEHVHARWVWMCEVEGKLIEDQPVYAGIHSGCGTSHL